MRTKIYIEPDVRLRLLMGGLPQFHITRALIPYYTVVIFHIALPPPRPEDIELHAKLILFSYRKLNETSKGEKVRARHLHSKCYFSYFFEWHIGIGNKNNGLYNLVSFDGHLIDVRYPCFFAINGLASLTWTCCCASLVLGCLCRYCLKI